MAEALAQTALVLAILDSSELTAAKPILVTIKYVLMGVFVKLVFVCARVASLEPIAVLKTHALESAAKTEVHARTEFAHALQDFLALTAV
jgi:bacteriorhodopsin